VATLSDGYGVKFVEDHALPPGQDWIFVEVDGVLWFVVKESRVTPEVLAQAWAAYRRMAFGPPIARTRAPLQLLARNVG
jgi:hypothetical protein